MTSLLIKLFIKDSENVDDPNVRSNYGTLSSFVGIFCNIFLCISKAVIGVLSGSVSIIADAFNNLSDMSGSIINLIGFVIARKPPDEEHPFGHARVEYLSGLCVSALIVFIGAQLFVSSFKKMLHPAPVDFSIPLVIVLLVSIFVKLWMNFFYKKLGAKINSKAIMAVSQDSKNDVITTTAVLLAAVISHYFGIQLDSIAGLVISVYILVSGIMLAGETISPLLGQKTDPELVKELESDIQYFDNKILEVHDLMIHDYGPGRKFATAHVEIDAHEPVIETHELIDSIERTMGAKYHLELVIHHDPVVLDDPEQNLLHREIKETLVGIDSRIRIHDFRLAKGNEETILIFDIVLPGELMAHSDDIEKKVSESFTRNEGKYALEITFDTESFNSFDGK